MERECFRDHTDYGKLEIQLYENFIYFRIPEEDPEFSPYQALKIAKKLIEFANKAGRSES